MKLHTALTWSWLNVLTKKRYNALQDVYGDLEAALEHLDGQLLKGLGCRDDTVELTMNRYEEFDPSAYERELKKRGLQFLTIEDDAYPERLKEIPDPPVFLYYRGDLDILKQPGIAVVGTRQMSSYGRRAVEAFISPLVRAGLVPVSGLARGIDAQCARETLSAQGRTVAVLGHGLAIIHPRSNAKLAEEIVAQGGLLLTEFPLDAPPGKYTFPARNRIIAGLSLGTVVMEAGEGSGALITAELALEYGRDVFAVPGQIFNPGYQGCHQLIARGQAKLVQSAEDILQEFNILSAPASAPSSYLPQTPEEEQLMVTLTSMPQSVTDLVQRSSLSAQSVNTTLTMMELQGAAKNVGQGLWVRA